MIVVVDDQQHIAIAKKCTSYVTLAPPPMEEESGHDIVCHIRWVHYGVDEEDRRGGGD